MKTLKIVDMVASLREFDEKQIAASLNEGRATLVTLVVHKELSLVEASKEMGVTVPTVRNAIKEAWQFSRIQ